jgi:hypothetical protein
MDLQKLLLRIGGGGGEVFVRQYWEPWKGVLVHFGKTWNNKMGDMGIVFQLALEVQEGCDRLVDENYS